jgi:hypothetical protein
VIIAIIDQDRVLTLKAEGDTPISADCDGPVPLEVSLQTMKPPSRSIHVFGLASAVQHDQLYAQTSGVLGLNSRN